MKIYSSFSELVGNTPIYLAKKYAENIDNIYLSLGGKNNGKTEI